MDFVGKVCPYCKTEFAEGDDIVVCSICEMPHHKECWIENKACTTFGCTGTIAGAEAYAQATENKSFCTQCGALLRDEQKFCSQCGTPVGTTGELHFQAAGESVATPQQQNTYAQPQQQAEDDLYTLIGTNQAWYISKFQKMQATNTKASWNWCSFLFDILWFAYRKMYGTAAILGVIVIVANFIPEIGGLIYLAIRICSGIFGNYLYKERVYDKLQVAQIMSYSNKSAYLVKKGGTNVGAVFIVIGVGLLVGIIFGIIEGFML